MQSTKWFWNKVIYKDFCWKNDFLVHYCKKRTKKESIHSKTMTMNLTSSNKNVISKYQIYTLTVNILKLGDIFHKNIDRHFIYRCFSGSSYWHLNAEKKDSCMSFTPHSLAHLSRFVLHQCTESEKPTAAHQPHHHTHTQPSLSLVPSAPQPSE